VVRRTSTKWFGFVKKQNCRIWASRIHQRPLHDARVTVWCGIMAHLVFGPFLFEFVQGHAVTVTGERYRQMLRHFYAVITGRKQRRTMIPAR
jgi:hypothetical protein